MKNDNINREIVLDMLDEIETEVAEGLGFQYAKWREYISQLKPTNEKTGEWVFSLGTRERETPMWVCSECHEGNSELPTYIRYPDGHKKLVDPYAWAGSSTCPHCGIRMIRKEM